MTRASELIALVEQPARVIVELLHQEHQPTLLLGHGQHRFDPIQFRADSPEGVVARVRAEVAHYRATEAAFVNELWSVALDAPEALLVAERRGGVVAHALPPEQRREVLMAYAEDNHGHWAFVQWAINAREPGGLVLERRHHDMRPISLADQELVNMILRRTGLRGMVAVRARHG